LRKKNAATSLDGQALAGGGLPRKKKFYYFWVFSHFHFAEYKSLPSVFPALGKGQKALGKGFFAD